MAGAERGHPGRMLLHGEPVAGGSSPPPRAYILAPPEPSSAALPARLPARRPLPQHRAAGAGARPPARWRSGLLQTRRQRHGPPRPPPGLPGPPPGSGRGRRPHAAARGAAEPPDGAGPRSGSGGGAGTGTVMRLRTPLPLPPVRQRSPERAALPAPAARKGSRLITLCTVPFALSAGKGEFTLSEPILY
ncbi:splicing factor, proline- and glutamine-rich-like [Oenanthe melanoleuca]|uniref:splicing factor, proline- and glutamine-rich-like n=1 Tax=Oenanthe melanoleuca TaxID=2939378 RepID=UPI0024C0F804|nr:splicing factor, proline- and glutamine-rich-like [Oenanthe melanoleuca]